MSRKTYLCIFCGEHTAAYKQIAHRNSHLADGFVFCSECVARIVEQDNDPDNVLRMLNIPYVHSIWEDAKSRNEGSTISEYLKMIAPQKKRYPEYKDSVHDMGAGDFQITEELVSRWGTLSDKEDYIDLELSYQDLVKLKPPISPNEDRQYIETVRLGKRYREEIEGGKASEISTLRRAYTESMKDIGLDSDTLYNKDSEMTIGTFIQKFENSEPIPEVSEEFKDVDRMTEYIRVIFTNTMKRAFGKATGNEIEEIHALKKSIIPRRNKG